MLQINLVTEAIYVCVYVYKYIYKVDAQFTLIKKFPVKRFKWSKTIKNMRNYFLRVGVAIPIMP